MATTFGDRLGQAIGASRFNQKRLADELGVTEGQVSRWVNDREVPGGKTLLRLPALLKVDGHWLLTGEGGPGTETDARARLEQVRQIVMKPAQDDGEHHAADVAKRVQPKLKPNRNGEVAPDAPPPRSPAKRRGGRRKGSA